MYVRKISEYIYNILDVVVFSLFAIVPPYTNIDDKYELYSELCNDGKKIMTNATYEFGWKTMEIISTINVFYKKKMVPTFHKITNNYFRTVIIIIKNGKEIQYFKKWQDLIKYEKNLDYDTIIYTDYHNSNSKQNYSIITDNINIHPKKMLENKCDLTFIIFQLMYNNEVYDINLKEPKNFFIKNNILKDNFFKWYMNKVYNINLGDEYNVCYMTQDLSTGNVKNPFYIKFNNDSISAFSTGALKAKPIEPKLQIITEDPKEYLYFNSDNSKSSSGLEEELEEEPSADKEEEPSADEDEEPSADEEEQSADKEEPSADEEEPSADEEEPTVDEDEKQSADKEEPSADKEVDEDEKQSADKEEPSADEEEPSADEEKNRNDIINEINSLINNIIKNEKLKEHYD